MGKNNKQKQQIQSQEKLSSERNIDEDNYREPLVENEPDKQIISEEKVTEETKGIYKPDINPTFQDEPKYIPYFSPGESEHPSSVIKIDDDGEVEYITPDIKVGTRVKLKRTTKKTKTGCLIPQFAYRNTYKVSKILNDRVIIRTDDHIGGYAIPVLKSDLEIL